MFFVVMCACRFKLGHPKDIDGKPLYIDLLSLLLERHLWVILRGLCHFLCSIRPNYESKISH